VVGHIRIELDLIWLQAGTEYAVAIFTDDAEPTVCAAKLSYMIFDDDTGERLQFREKSKEVSRI
jgi:hypothetical protein